MKKIILSLIIILIVGVANLEAQKLQRLPMQKKKNEIKTPAVWSKSTRIDPRTKKEIPYDPMPKIEVANAKAGKYYLKWIGYDGKQKVTIYQRPDCVDVVIAASISRASSGAFAYEYEVQSLITSGDYLQSFALQTFSSDILPKRPANNNNVIILDMSPGIFSQDGTWIMFGPIPPHPYINPGQKIKFTLHSTSPPGIVMCRVSGGTRVIEGVGEDMPGELGETLPGYEALPSGYTIGPIDKLTNFSKPERAKYVLELLPQFQKLGWMTAKASQQYEKFLRNQDLEGAYKRAEQDLKLGAITSEILSILQGLQTK